MEKWSTDILWPFKMVVLIVCLIALIPSSLRYQKDKKDAKSKYENEFMYKFKEYNYKINERKGIRSLSSSSENYAHGDAAVSGGFLFTLGYATYDQGESYYYVALVIHNDGAISKEKFFEGDCLFYEDVSSIEDSYVEYCTKSTGFDEKESDLYRLHIPAGYMVQEISII